MTRSRLAGNIASLVSLQAANFLVPLIVLPFLTRALGIERFGLFAFSQAVCMYLVLVTEFGFNLSSTRSIAAERADGQRVALLFWSTLAARTVLGLGSLLALAFAVALIPRLRADGWVYVAAAIPVVSAVITPVWYFQGMEIIRPLAITQVAFRALFAVATFLLVGGPGDVALAVAMQGFGPLAAGVICWAFIYQMAPVHFMRPTLSDVRARLSESRHVFLSSAAISLYTTSNVFILGLVTSNVQVGYFSVAEKIARAGTGFVAPITQAVYPRVASLAAQARDEALALLRKVLLAFSVIGVLVFALLISFPGTFLELIGGVNALPAHTSMQLLSSVPLVVAISSVLGTLTMLNFGLDRQFSRIVVGVGIVNVGLLAVLSHFFQSSGAAASLLLAELLVVLLTGACIKRAGIYSDLFNLRKQPLRNAKDWS